MMKKRTVAFFFVSVLASAAVTRAEDFAEVDAAEIARGTLRDKDVCVSGVVSSVFRDDVDSQWNWIILRTPSGKICAAGNESCHPLARIGELRDAEVVLYGRVSVFGTWRRFLGFDLMLAENGVRIVKPPPRDPFAVPDFADIRTLHRQRETGVVLAVGAERIFIRTEHGGFLPVKPVAGTPPPEVGKRITVAGFAEPDQNNPQFVEAVLRCEPGPLVPPDAAADVDPERLFTDVMGREQANPSYYGKIIRLRGVVANMPANVDVSGKLQLACGKQMVAVDVSRLRGALPPEIRTGYGLEISGVCFAEFESDTTTIVFPRFKGFTIILRSSADIRIVARPPWWTPGRLGWVIGVLLGIIAAILCWNRALNVLSKRRGRELYDERITSARAELKVEERTRLAVELHDALSQTLTGVSLQLDAATRSGERNGRTSGTENRFLETARALLDACRRELGCCLWDLRSRTFEEKDMTEAVSRAVALYADTANVAVRFNVPRESLSESTTHVLLKTIRELVANAVRHAKASHVKVTGEFRNGVVRFSVRDNGEGFDPAVAPGPAQGHFGLQGIRERLDGLDGKMTVESAPGTGTKITVSFKQGTDE